MNTAMRAEPKTADAKAGRVVTETELEKNGTIEEEEEFVILVKIPKPEALLFSGRHQIRYNSIPLEKSFAARIVEDAKKAFTR